MDEIERGIHAGYSRTMDDTGNCNLQIDLTVGAYEGSYECVDECEFEDCPRHLKEYQLTMRGERGVREVGKE